MNQTFKAKGIFLDLDGTLIDSTNAYLEAAKIASKTVGLKPPDRRIALEIPRRIEQGLSISEFINGETEKFLPVYYKTYYQVVQEKSRLLPNVSTTLEVLSQKAKLALITMRHAPKKTILCELQYLGIKQYFAHVLTALDTSKPKPSPEALLNCVEALNLDIENCLIAGDSVIDVRAGKSAGAKTVALLSGLYACEELEKEKPDLILNDVNSLPSFIE